MHRAFLWHIDKDRTLSADFAGLRLTIEPAPGEPAPGHSPAVHFKVAFADPARQDFPPIGSGSAAEVKAAMTQAETIAWSHLNTDLQDR